MAAAGDGDSGRGECVLGRVTPVVVGGGSVVGGGAVQVVRIHEMQTDIELRTPRGVRARAAKLLPLRYRWPGRRRRAARCVGSACRVPAAGVEEGRCRLPPRIGGGWDGSRW